MKYRRRALAIGGLVGPAAFVGGWLLAGATSSHYSPVNSAISDLAAVGASSRVTMTVGFVGFGLGVIAFGFALRDALDGHAGIAAIATGGCTIAVAATPLGGWSGDAVHATFAGSGYVTIVAMQLLAARALARSDRANLARASVVTGAISAACLAASTLGPAHGLWQRLGLTTGDVWIVSAATAILCTPAINRAPAMHRV